MYRKHCCSTPQYGVHLRCCSAYYSYHSNREWQTVNRLLGQCAKVTAAVPNKRLGQKETRVTQTERVCQQRKKDVDLLYQFSWLNHLDSINHRAGRWSLATHPVWYRGKTQIPCWKDNSNDHPESQRSTDKTAGHFLFAKSFSSNPKSTKDKKIKKPSAIQTCFFFYENPLCETDKRIENRFFFLSCLKLLNKKKIQNANQEHRIKTKK